MSRTKSNTSATAAKSKRVPRGRCLLASLQSVNILGLVLNAGDAFRTNGSPLSAKAERVQAAMPGRSAPAYPCSGVPVSFCPANGQAGSRKSAATGTLAWKRKHLTGNFDSHPMTMQDARPASNFVHRAEQGPNNEIAPRCEGRGLELGISEQATQQLSIDDPLD